VKYIIYCSIAMIVCFGLGFIAAHFIFKQKKHRKVKTAITTVLGGVALMAAVTLCYLGIYYHAGEQAAVALGGSDEISVTKIDCGYFFDSKESDCALIFYGGAKVECEAYAPLMTELAQNGIDCFLIDMPFNFAIIGANKADAVLAKYDYETVIMAGHSMGGMMAAKYANSHVSDIDGLVLLASYSTEKIDDGISVLSIYGSCDGCLDKAEYIKNKVRPKNMHEIIIDGGNHSGFADYGEQKGDGVATITASEQQSITAKAIADYFKTK